MIEKILENVINAMVPHLEPDQLEKLNNVLYINFHTLVAMPLSAIFSITVFTFSRVRPNKRTK